MKRILSVLLSTCIVAGLLAGCKSEGGKSGEVPMGRYIEEQGEVLENLSRAYNFHRAADGSTVFYGQTQEPVTYLSAYHRYTVPADGGPVQVEDIPGLGDLAKNGLRGIADGADGTRYVLYNTEDMQYRVARSVDGGTFEPIAVADLVAEPSPVGQQGGISMGGSISMGGGVSVITGDEAKDEADASGSDAISFGETGVAYSSNGAATPEGAEAEVESSGSGSISFGEVGNIVMPEKFPSDIRVLDSGDFLILYGDKGVSRYSPEGALLAEYTGTAYTNNTAVYGNTLLITSTDGSELWSYDMESGKQNGSYAYDNLTYATTVGMDADGVYLADSTGVYRQNEGGSIWEKLVDGDLTSLVMPNMSIGGVAPDGKGSYCALLTGEKSAQVMRYVYSAETPTNPDTELTIFGLHDNNTVRQTIGEFQRRNPNVRVNFRVGLDTEGAATAEDIIRALNTEFLAGKGPDLLLLDGLPVDSYIEKGVLADITALVDEQSNLLPNLMNAYEKDGKRYGVPSRFTFPVMMGTSADVDAMKSLDDLVAKVKAGQGNAPKFLRVSEDLWIENGVGIMMDYYEACVGTWMSGDGTIDQANLAKYLSAMTELDKTMKLYTPQLGDGMASMTTVAIASIGGSGGYEPINMGPMDLKNGKAVFHTQEMAGLFGLQMTSQGLTSLGGQKLASLFGGGAYVPKGGVAIAAGSKQQELAQDFVKMLLSATVQDSYLYDGYPVNSSSLEKLVADLMEEIETDDMGFLALCSALNTPLLTDQVVKDAVEAQMKGLMDGSVTPDQAAANVVEKTQLYLAE